MTQETTPSRDSWARAETAAKIGSLVAIPVVLAIVGWLVQDKLAARTVNKDYVQLAVSILSQPKQAAIDPALRSWAVELLNENSPVKFSAEVSGQLRTGVATLPLEQSENLRALARSYSDAGNYAKAEAALQQALALQEKEFGSDHPAVSDTLANLATLYLAMGDFPKAETYYKRALAIREKTLGPDDVNVARLLSNLATVYDAKGDFPAAQILRQRAEAIYRMASSK